MTDRLLTTGEAARELGLNSRSVARWAKQGRIRPTLVTPGGHFRWTVEDLRAQLRELNEQRQREQDS